MRWDENQRSMSRSPITTPRSIVHDNPTELQAVTTIPIFYATQKFITMLTTARLVCPSRSILINLTLKILFLKPILYYAPVITQNFQVVYFSRFPHKNSVYTSCVSHTCPTMFHFIAQVISLSAINIFKKNSASYRLN